MARRTRPPPRPPPAGAAWPAHRLRYHPANRPLTSSLPLFRLTRFAPVSGPGSATEGVERSRRPRSADPVQGQVTGTDLLAGPRGRVTAAGDNHARAPSIGVVR